MPKQKVMGIFGIDRMKWIIAFCGVAGTVLVTAALIIRIQNGFTITNGSIRSFEIGAEKHAIFLAIRKDGSISNILLNNIKSTDMVDLSEGNFNRKGREISVLIVSHGFREILRSRDGVITEIVPILNKVKSENAGEFSMGDTYAKMSAAILRLQELDGPVTAQVLPSRFRWMNVSNNSDDINEEFLEAIESSDHWSFTLDGSRKNFQMYFHENRLVRLDYRWFIFETP